MQYKNFEIKERSFEGELLYEIFAVGKLQYAMVHHINSQTEEKWVVTPETFSETINDDEVQEIGAYIESINL